MNNENGFAQAAHIFHK